MIAEVLPNSVIIFFAEVLVTKFSCRLTQTWCLFRLMKASFTMSLCFVVHFATICIWIAIWSASRAKCFWNILILFVLLWKSLYREDNCFWSCWIMTPELVSQGLSVSWWVGRFRGWKYVLISLSLVACTVNARAMTHFLPDNHGAVLPCFIVKMSIPFPSWNNLLKAAPPFSHLTSVHSTASSYSYPASTITCCDRPCWKHCVRHITVPITSSITNENNFSARCLLMNNAVELCQAGRAHLRKFFSCRPAVQVSEPYVILPLSVVRLLVFSNPYFKEANFGFTFRDRSSPVVVNLKLHILHGNFSSTPLESACKNKKGRTRNKIPANVLATRQTIYSVTAK